MDVYTTEEAAVYLGVKRRTIKKYASASAEAPYRLTPLRQIGRSYVFSKEELDRFKALPKRAGGRPRKKPPEE